MNQSLPESARLYKKRKLLNGLFWTLAVLAVACIVAFLFCIIMLGLAMADFLLLCILSGSFFAAAVLFSLCAYPVFWKSDKVSVSELDALEREDDPFSFFVGEGTLATFRKDELFLHGGEEEKEPSEEDDPAPVRKKKNITVPYFDIKFFSVCTRRRPKEEGRWSVVMQIPARYFNKGALKDAQPLLVQTDGKERLYLRMEELGLKLEGELPPRYPKLQPGGEKAQKGAEKKFTQLKKFVLPDQKRRSRAFILLLFGVVFLVGGILAAALWDPSVGGVIILVGGYIGVRALIAYLRAKAQFFLFEEGIFYGEPTGVDNVFLKWDEFSAVKKVVRDGKDRLRAECPYGAYDFPLFEGALENILALHPEKAEASAAAGEGEGA